MYFSEYVGQRSRSVQCVCLLILLATIMVTKVGAQISPGELSNAHSMLNGSGHCMDCHDRGKRPPEFKCMACHKEIQSRIMSGKGLHASLVGGDKSGRKCVQCHNEHNGRDFILIRWRVPLNQFDHTAAGYRLEGKHAGAKCRACHSEANIPALARASILVKDLNRTYLGLSPQCSGCHKDVHNGELQGPCNRCHDAGDWKKPIRFNHDEARFRIEGVHRSVACAKCHAETSSRGTTAKYRNIQFEDCSPCHRDPHAGVFKERCSRCHSTNSSWTPVSVDTGFNHSKTPFPLTGRHAKVACKSCHVRADFGRPIAFRNCRDCHAVDPHRGQFDSKWNDCDGCHTVQGFKPSIFGVAQHDKSVFPLQEHHRTVPCSDCHKPDSASVVRYRLQNFSCSSCHRDIHEGQFADVKYGNRCEACHSQTAFRPSLFTAVQHASTRFPLSGGHTKLECERCHRQEPRPSRYRFEDLSCAACHTDVHSGQFVSRMSLRLSDGTMIGCRACHTVVSWREMGSFDHSSTGFTLEGAHRNVECRQCHMTIPGKADPGKIFYREAPKHCEGCHKDPHEGQFSAGMVFKADNTIAGCRKCHSVNSWHEITFDHSATSFALSGAHQSVKCERCHAKAAGVTVLYANAPKQCAGCHEDIHGGQFDLSNERPACDRCHQSQKWVPSEFNHDTQSTYALTGAHRNVACAACHSQIRRIAGREVTVFKGTARECSACHASDKTGKQP